MPTITRKLNSLWARFFGVEGAAMPCKKPTALWSVYRDEMHDWWFSWHSEDHTQGETRGPFLNEQCAVWGKDRWASAHRDAILVEVRGA